MAQLTRIVVLGGGFGGAFTALRLRDRFKADPSVEISLVNRENYFVFQPMLPEVAAGSIEPSQIANPLRRMLNGVRFYASDVASVDVASKQVAIYAGEGRHLRTLPYDHLVVALGTVVDLSSLPGLSEHSLTLKNIGDAFYLRNHVIGCLEQADIEDDEQHRRALTTSRTTGTCDARRSASSSSTARTASCPRSCPGWGHTPRTSYARAASRS
jgi:NADH dehydrogenase